MRSSHSAIVNMYEMFDLNDCYIVMRCSTLCLAPYGIYVNVCTHAYVSGSAASTAYG
jgi:hypothetical protein